MIEAKPGVEWIIIDEVQKIPKLLDIVHQLSSDKSMKFVLTGSIARKLKRGNANLLAGRAFNYECFPLTFQEIVTEQIVRKLRPFKSFLSVAAQMNGKI